jgi:hypothetical protein
VSTLREELALERHAEAESMAKAEEYWAAGNIEAWRDLRAEAAKCREYIRELERRLAEEGR